jgi:hypothetical protein
MSDSDLWRYCFASGRCSITPSLHIAELWRYSGEIAFGERLPTLNLAGDGIEGRVGYSRS